MPSDFFNAPTLGKVTVIMASGLLLTNYVYMSNIKDYRWGINSMVAL